MCRVCGGPLFRILTLHDQPSQAQHLADACLTDLRVARCAYCGLVQLENTPVPYWRESVDTGEDSPAMVAFRAEQEKRWGPLDFISRNRLEHMPRPVNYLRSFHGRGVIEVPNIVALAPHEFVADHLLYFDPHTLTNTLALSDFTVESLEVVWHGHVLSAVVKRPLRVVWGAGHQALSMMALHGIDPDYIVDSATFKHGAIWYGAVVSEPERIISEPPDLLIVACAGFNDEVCAAARTLGYVGAIKRFDDGRFVDATD
jgi:hypothetical protein